ncbi:MAG TPA: hypothetical protein VL500_04735 [Candidatus Eisenbacteria bacterium]|jgi:hypothetical protein|nr:hypothetical protein [Candidatus Eisenbacteria bacterium]
MIARIRRWSERRRRAKRKPRPVTFRFHDPCFGPTGESLTLPPGVRRAAEALDGKRLTLSEALVRLQQAIAPHGGFLEVPERRRYVLWHMPSGKRGVSQLHYLIRLK